MLSSADGVGLSQVEDLLGLGHGEQWLDLATHLLMGNTSASLEAINQAAWDGTDLRQLHRQTQELLRAVMHLQWNAGAVAGPSRPRHKATGRIGRQAAAVADREGVEDLGRGEHALRRAVHLAPGAGRG